MFLYDSTDNYVNAKYCSWMYRLILRSCFYVIGF